MREPGSECDLGARYQIPRQSIKNVKNDSIRYMLYEKARLNKNEQLYATFKRHIIKKLKRKDMM